MPRSETGAIPMQRDGIYDEKRKEKVQTANDRELQSGSDAMSMLQRDDGACGCIDPVHELIIGEFSYA